jgi:hypothetical protein
MLKFRLHRHAKQNPSLRHQDFLWFSTNKP